MPSQSFSVLLVLILAVSLFSIPRSSDAASFDCAKAMTKVEKLICSNADLSKIDEKLHSVYQRLLAKFRDKREIRTSQRHWLKTVRDSCKTFHCVWFAYKDRIYNLQRYPDYRFSLTQGKGTPVCESFLQRLNRADWTIVPPYCNIPEKTNVPGFTPLNRVPLTVKEISVIQPRISDFVDNGQQGNKEDDAKYRAWQIRNGVTPDEPLHIAKSLIRKGWEIWRYTPQVDIDNDGTPDNVVEWRAGQCGKPLQTSTIETDGRKPTEAFILVAGNNRIDSQKTRDIFSSANGDYPVGPTIDIFKYQHLYYIDTFVFDGPINQWGYLPYSDAELEQAHTLAVYLRRQGKTRRMCEYHMTDLAK